MDSAIEERLRELGLTKAQEKLSKFRQAKRKMALAYEHFRFVKQEHIDKFRHKLAAESGWAKTLDFVPLEQYEKIPPTNVLDDLEKAMGIGCFDRYEVAEVREVKDPILFGRIESCPDYFYISQWDDDVKITDLLKDNEG